ncbi:MAG TPA: HPr family phosphocarrier protein [Gemmataceae bacterium]|nr:HPr family phosphocarrier protein [Gemmataceae bacterium]
MSNRPKTPSERPNGADPPGPPAGPPAVPPRCASGPLKRTIRIINPHGVHSRIADRFSRTAQQFRCNVTVWNGENKADGKSIFDLVLLVVMPDSDVVLELEGDDAAAALEPLTEILAASDGEDYTI